MARGRQPKLKNEELYKALESLLVLNKWTPITVKEIINHVQQETGISYTVKGLSCKLAVLVEDGKLEYQTDWPAGKWRLLGEGGNANGTSSSQ